MKFIKKWEDYLKESLSSSKQAEMKKKRAEIESKIHKIESDMKYFKDAEIPQEDIDAVVPTVNVQELELKLESLKLELGKLDEKA